MMGLLGRTGLLYAEYVSRLSTPTYSLIIILVVSRNVQFVHFGSDWGARLARFPRVFFRPLAEVFSGRRVSMVFLGDGEPLSFPDQARETRHLYRVVQA